MRLEALKVSALERELDQEDTELRETEGQGGTQGTAASCGICLIDLHLWDFFCHLQASLKASKLELEAKLQEKDSQLKQMEARTVLSRRRPMCERLGFVRHLLWLEASLKAANVELEASLQEKEQEFTEAVAALQMLEARDMF